jgi:hypothetical protein
MQLDLAEGGKETTLKEQGGYPPLCSFIIFGSISHLIF